MIEKGAQFGYIKDGKVFLKAYMDFPYREIGIVKIDDEKSLEYFTNRFDLAINKVLEVQNDVENSINKGSYLMKIIHLRTYLETFNGLGDFKALFAIIDVLETEIREYIRVNRIKNTEIKTSLLKEAKDALRIQNQNEVASALKEIKIKWIKTGSAEDEIDEAISEEFRKLYDDFFEKRKNNYERIKKLQQEKVKKIKDIVYALVNIVNTEPENSLAVVNGLKEEFDKLWGSGNKNAKKEYGVFQKYFNIYHSQKRDELGNLIPVIPKTPEEEKIDLLEEVKDINSGKLTLVISKVRMIQKRWKELGRFPTEQDKNINLEFRIVCNEIFEEYFLEQEVQAANPNHNTLPKIELLKIKIRHLEESLKNDEFELSMLNRQTRGLPPNSEQAIELNKNKLNYINKVKTKQRIFKKLQDQLFTSY